MPAKTSATPIGRVVCRKCRTETAAVFANKKNYLYARCPKCFADQANGAAAQEYFWTNTRLLPGIYPEEIERPPNLPEYLDALGEPAPAPPEPQPLPLAPVISPPKQDPTLAPEPAAQAAETVEDDNEQADAGETPKPKKGGAVALLMMAVSVVGFVIAGTSIGGGQ